MEIESRSNLSLRDGYNQSPWQHSVKSRKAKPEDISQVNVYDMVIIGAGITGITTALRLQEAGRKRLIVEAHSMGFGTTGGTSAHINTFADTTYKETESAFGKEGAKLFADAIIEGFSMIRENIKNHGIQCDFEVKKG